MSYVSKYVRVSIKDFHGKKHARTNISNSTLAADELKNLNRLHSSNTSNSKIKKIIKFLENEFKEH